MALLPELLLPEELLEALLPLLYEEPELLDVLPLLYEDPELLDALLVPELELLL